MASSRPARPVGFAIVPRRRKGTLARTAPPLPGPLGVHAATATVDAQRHATNSPWIELDLRQFAGSLAGRIRRGMLVRVVRGADSDDGYRCLEVPGPPAAAALAARLLDDPAVATRVAELADVPATGLAAWTAEQLARRGIKVLWRVRQPITTSAPPAPAPTTAPRRVAPSAPSAPAPEYATFPPDLDAAAIAQGLKAAASDGVPFCEECMKQAQAGGGGATAGAA